MKTNDVVIVDAARTPMGRSKGGMFAQKRADDLSAELLKGVIARNPNIEWDEVDDIMWGCVQQTMEQGYNLARFVGLLAGLKKEIPAMTLNRLCGSSMAALHTAVAYIKAGEGEFYVVGGTEHMGHVPMNHGLDFHPTGGQLYAKASCMMGVTAEYLAKEYGITREQQDEFALRSHQNASEATNSGKFKDEIIPILGHDTKGLPKMFREDEVFRKDANLESLRALPGVFMPKGGTVTAGNSSAISDGASVLLVMSLRKAKKLKLTPLARVVSMATVGLDPAIMGFGPVPAVEKALSKAEMKLQNIDLFEINEAFAAQSLSVLKKLELDPNKVNTKGGAIALGHPLGCSGARITTTLLHAMKQDARVKHGVSSMCIGFGQGIATVFESCH